MDLDSLRIFDAVATELSITRAATRLGRAPSNVTTRIQQLEADLGAELLVRIGKRIALSAAGQQFQTYGRRMLALEDEARQMLGTGSAGLRIGSMESTAASRLPEPLAAYHQAHPQTRLQIVTGPSISLLEQVRQGLLDCAFVALPTTPEHAETLANNALQGLQLWQEQLLLVLPASETGATGPHDIRCRSLAAFRPGCSYRALAEQTLAVDADWQVQELGSYHSMLACVAAGSCVTILPRSVLELCRVPEELPVLEVSVVPTWLVWREGFATPAFEGFSKIMQACA